MRRNENSFVGWKRLFGESEDIKSSEGKGVRVVRVAASWLPHLRSRNCIWLAIMINTRKRLVMLELETQPVKCPPS